jgi:uncharacterized protein YbaP (TraB family)
MNVSMKLKRLFATAAALSLTLSGCAGMQSETPPAGACRGRRCGGSPMADTTIYLFGTVHALPEGKTWFDTRIARAFDASDEMVTEVDLSDQTASSAAMQAAGLCPRASRCAR